jgi:hypothetical protein
MAMCDAFKENEELQAIVEDNTFSADKDSTEED